MYIKDKHEKSKNIPAFHNITGTLSVTDILETIVRVQYKHNILEKEKSTLYNVVIIHTVLEINHKLL